MARCLPACCEANRHEPVFPPFTLAFGPGLHVLSGGVGDGRTPGPCSERPPVPVRSTPSPATPPGTPSSTPANSTPSAPLRGHERPRQDHGPGNSGLPRGETCAPGGGSGQPRREWTKGSHSPGSRRAARRCSSRERGDWPGPAGRACTGGRRPERRRAAPAQQWRAPTARRTYPSAEPKPRGGLTRGGPRITIRRLGTSLRPPPISQLNSRIAPARGKKKIFSFKNNDDYSAIHTLIFRPPGPPAFPVRPRPTGLPRPPGPAPAP